MVLTTSIVRFLLEDARRSYRELAERVDPSTPAVSDRLDRLREIGVIERFTVEIDRTRLQEGVRVVVTFDVTSGESGTLREALAGTEGVEHVFARVDSRLFVASVPDGDVERHLASAFETGAVEAVDVAPLVVAD